MENFISHTTPIRREDSSLIVFIDLNNFEVNLNFELHLYLFLKSNITDLGDRCLCKYNSLTFPFHCRS